jgi:hypothetical protein
LKLERAAIDCAWRRLRRAKEGLRVDVALYAVVYEIERGTRVRLIMSLPSGIDLNQTDEFCNSLMFQAGDRFSEAMIIDEDEDE